MADTLPCHLLKLPRELRNIIYGHVGVSHAVTLNTDKESDEPSGWLRNSLNLSLMRVCRQVHDEYQEVWAVLLHLELDMCMRMDLSEEAVPLREDIPSDVLSKIKTCHIQLHYGTFFKKIDPEWVLGYAILKGKGRPLTVTPSKIAAAFLFGMLEQFAIRFTSHARVCLTLQSGPIELFECLSELGLADVAPFTQLVSLAQTKLTSRRSRESFQLEVLFYTPMSWEIVPGSFALADTQSTTTTGLVGVDRPLANRTICRADGVTYTARPSTQLAHWILMPQSVGGTVSGFRGFATQFMGTMDEKTALGIVTWSSEDSGRDDGAVEDDSNEEEDAGASEDVVEDEEEDIAEADSENEEEDYIDEDAEAEDGPGVDESDSED